MKIERDGEHSVTSRRWIVTTPASTYRVRCEWSGGSQRMEWAVEAAAKLRNGPGWRSIRGLDYINAVREYECRRARLEQ